MHPTRHLRTLLAALLATTLVLGGTAVASADGGHDKRQDQAERALEQARKARRQKPNVTEAKGAVAAVNPTARTMDVNVTEANQAAIRGIKLSVKLAPEAYLSINDRTVGVADVKVGDTAKLRGLLDGTTGPMTAYVVQLRRTPPAPTTTKGTVTALTATTFTVAVGTTATTTLTLGTPSIVSLNGAPATLADAKAGDKVEATTVGTTAYVARFTRPVPKAASPVRVDGTVVTVSPLVLSVKGVNVTVAVATPAVIARNDVTATMADVKVGDRASVTGIKDATTGALTAYVLAFFPAS